MKVKDQAAEQQQELAKTLENRATSAETELIAPSYIEELVVRAHLD